MKIDQIFKRKSISGILNELNEYESKNQSLKKNLRLVDLVAFGIAAIIGAGIFSTIGNAAFYGGPAVSLLFVFTAIACVFSAFCFAEFASKIPISGSAYTYAYSSFGEIIAWIMGWILIMEYAFGNIAVAISWSDYFVGLLSGFNIHVPDFLSIDYFSAIKNHKLAISQLNAGEEFSALPFYLRKAYDAVENAPVFFGIKLIANIPAFSIVVLVTILVYIGIQQTKRVSNIMVVLKVVILLLVIIVGAFYVNPQNWSPFAPNGASGVFKGVAAVFFAFIGFDAISTTAEECKNPQRDLPKAMILSLLITTVIYVLVSLVITGIVHFSDLAVGDPLSYAFNVLGLNRFSGIIAFGAVVSMTGVLLVFQMGQPRIWLSMSRDGLLPKKFSTIHKKFKTPSFATIITGVLVGLPALFMNLTEVTDLTSIGTLFAFIIVCGGILVIQNDKNYNTDLNSKSKFKIPYLNSRIFISLLLILSTFSALFFFNISQILNNFFEFKNYIVLVLCLIISVLSIVKKWSLIPVLGLIFNIYLISRIDGETWNRFLIWLLIGLVIYFLYGFRKSKLRNIKN